MLNPFPIQFLAPLAYFILRLALGAFFLHKGKVLLGNMSSHSPSLYTGIIHTLVGCCFIVGFGTQIAALAAMVISIQALIWPNSRFVSMRRDAALLSLGMALALFITGAGPFAFDLPI